MSAPTIHYSELDDKFWINDGDDVLWFDGPLQAKDAMRQIELRRAAEEERAKIVAWLRDGFKRDFDQLWRDQLIAAIEAGEHLK